jgi:integrase
VQSHLPDDLKDFALFAYLTGWRRGECASIGWQNVEDGVIRLRAEDTKNGEPRSIPIEGELVQIIERRKKARLVDGVLTALLFHRDGRAIAEFRKSWATACRLAGVHRLFHDLRRTAVRNFVRTGVSEKIAMTISGHKTRSIFDRYDIVAETEQRDALQKVERYRQNSK